MDGVALDEFSNKQKWFATEYNGDKGVKDLPRVMRLAGFLHSKSEPSMVRILEANGDLPPYKGDEFPAGC